MDFQLLGDVKDIEPIAVNLFICERKSLKSRFGGRHWRQLKGVALVRIPNGEVRREVHWEETRGTKISRPERFTKPCLTQRPPAWAAFVVIDESGEDCLYPVDRFVAVDFPKDVRARLPKWQPSNGPDSAGQATAKRQAAPSTRVVKYPPRQTRTSLRTGSR